MVELGELCGRGRGRATRRVAAIWIDRDCTGNRVCLRFGLDDEHALVGGDLNSRHRKLLARRTQLPTDGGIAGAHDFEFVPRADVRAVVDGDFLCEVLDDGRIERAVEGDSHFGWTRGVGEEGLRVVGGGVGDFVERSLAGWAGAPIGRAAVAGDDEIALGRDAGIDRQHRQRRDDLVFRDIAGGGFGEGGAEDFAARFAAEDRVILPPRRAEGWAAVDGCVERQATSGLMLRRVIEGARFVDDARVVDRMPRRETVMAALLDVEQLVERIAVGEPGGAFLVGAKKIAGGVERHAHGKADAGAVDFAVLEIGRDVKDGAPFLLEVVVGFSGRLVDLEAVGEIHAADTEENAVVGRNGDAEGIDLMKRAGPALGDDDFLVELSGVGRVEQQRELALVGDEDAVAERIMGRRECDADGDGHAALVVPPELGFILQSVAVSVAQKINISVVSDGDELAVGAVADVVDVGQVERKLAHRKAGDEHLNRRGIVDGLKNLSGDLIAAERLRRAFMLFLKIRFDAGEFICAENAIENQKLGDIAVEKSADVGRDGVVGETSGAQDELIGPKHAGRAGAGIAGGAVDPERYAFFAGGGGDGEGLELVVGERAVKQVFRAGEAIAFDVEELGRGVGFGFGWAEVNRETALVIVLSRFAGGEKGAEIAVVGAGKRRAGW